MSNDRSARQLIHNDVCTNNLLLGSINYIELGYWSLSHPFWKIMHRLLMFQNANNNNNSDYETRHILKSGPSTHLTLRTVKLKKTVKCQSSYRISQLSPGPGDWWQTTKNSHHFCWDTNIWWKK